MGTSNSKMERRATIASLYRGQRPHKFNNGDLVFQSLFWEKEDQEVDEEDEEEEEDDYGYDAFDDDDGFGYKRPKKKKYKEKRLVLRTYGLTKEGISVCLEITGFKPYFLLKLPPSWGKSKIKTLESRISSMVGYRKRELSYSTVRMKKLYYFDNYKDHTFLKISFKTDGARWDTMKALIPKEKHDISPDIIKFQETNQLNIGGIRVKLHVYESTMDTIIRFIHLSEIKPSGILKIEGKNLKRNRTRSTCQIVKSVDWKDVSPVDEDWIAPFRVSSYDIECTSKDGSFPQASRIEDKIIQIGTTTRIYGEKHCRIRHIVTLKNSNDIPDVKHKKHPDELVIVECVKTERELLILWAKHICALDPDVMIGYNIFGFDWKYIYDRARKLRCESQVSRLGRLLNKECKLKEQSLSSSAMGHNSLSYPLMNGRVQIDLLPVIRSSHRLSSYKLDNVAKVILGLRKNDLPPDQIFARFKTGSSEDIKVIAEYCIQDCLLVNNLFDKLDIFVNSIGMSNVCLVPISLLFTRGQGIKVYSKITEKCLKRNTAFPTLVKLEHKKDGKKVGYEGAIVLDPIPGFYDDPIAVLDYGSLYPSTIIEHNISYETYLKEPQETVDEKMDGDCRYNPIEFDIYEGEKQNKKKVGVKTCVYAEPLLEKPKDEHDKKMMGNLKGKGIVPSLLQDLLSARKAAKKQMAQATDPFKKAVYNGKQLALKVTANSVYGYTGAKFSDLRFMDLAASTTAGGRQKIYTAKSLAQDNYKGAVVIYGDTDSIFINLSKCPQLKGLEGKELLAATIKLGEEMADFITSQLRAPQVLEYEKTFWPFMIITKKRYAGNKYEFSPDKYKFTSMGLVTKRRDNAPILKTIYKGVLDIMFNNQYDTSTAVKMAVKLYQESATDLLKGNVDLKDLVVSKTLKTGYKNPTAITHKVLAEKIADRDPGNAPSSNERIPYVFIDAKELKCHTCNKKVNVTACKCKVCMYLYCSTHLRRHRDNCVPRCRMCWTQKKVSCCGVCGGGYCNKHKLVHKCSNINEKALQGDFAETPSYISENNISVDYRYYLDHQIRKPVSQIFELIKETKGVDPLKKIIIRDNNRINRVRNITDFFK